MNDKAWPLGVKYENRDHGNAPDGTQVYIRKNWPDPEVKGIGIVKTKDGKVKTDGSNS